MNSREEGKGQKGESRGEKERELSTQTVVMRVYVQSGQI